MEALHAPPARGRLPSALRDFIYRPAPEEKQGPPGPLAPPGVPSAPNLGRERNLLLLLHGFGGRKEPFADLASSLQLPKTAVMALNGPEALPEELLDEPPGFSWYTVLDEEVMDFIQPDRQELRRLRSLQRSRRLLSEVLEALMEAGAWRAEEIFLLGYGQGGTLALEMLLPPGGAGAASWAGRLGGVLAVASELLPERRWQLERSGGGPSPQAPESGVEGTGVLMINGGRDELVPLASAEASANLLRGALAGGKGSARLEAIPQRGGEMLRGGCAEEMQLVMEFFAERLHGVGRRGSEEAMERLGAERVDFVEQLPAGAEAEEEEVAGDGGDEGRVGGPAGAGRSGAALRLEEMD